MTSVAGANNNRRIEFDDLDPTLKQIIKKSIEDGILTQSAKGIYVKTFLIINPAARHEKIEFAKKRYSPQEFNFVEWVVNTLDKKSINRGKTHLDYDEIQAKFLSMQRSNPTEIGPSGAPGKDDDLGGGDDLVDYLGIDRSFFEDDTDPSEVSDHRLESPSDPLKALGEGIEKIKSDMRIYISKINRDHNINVKGFLDPKSDLFNILCTEFSTDFNNGSGWSTIIPAAHGVGFSLSLHKNGHIRMWINHKLSWDIFMEQFWGQFKSLEFTQFSQLLEVFEYNRDKLFILETANMIGPRPVIDKTLKGAMLSINNIYSHGKLSDILVKVDYSEDDPEIEFIGPEDPTRKLQDLVVRPMEVVQSLGHLEHTIENNLDATNAVLQNQNDMALEASKNHKSTMERFATVEQQQLTTVQVMKESQEVSKAQFGMVVDELHTGHEIILNELQLGKEQNTWLHEEVINRIDSLQDSITKIIDDRIQTLNQNFKNNLYLVLRALETLPGRTVKELSEELKIPQKSLYRYFSRLRGAELIASKKIEEIDPKKGRPKTRFFRK